MAACPSPRRCNVLLEVHTARAAWQTRGWCHAMHEKSERTRQKERVSWVEKTTGKRLAMLMWNFTASAGHRRAVRSSSIERLLRGPVSDDAHLPLVCSH
jgi:hypothetical protein